jgi:hypothetical protein
MHDPYPSTASVEKLNNRLKAKNETTKESVFTPLRVYQIYLNKKIRFIFFRYIKAYFLYLQSSLLGMSFVVFYLNNLFYLFKIGYLGLYCMK